MTEAIAGGEPKAEAMWDRGSTETSVFLIPVPIPAGKQGKGGCLPVFFLVVKYKNRAFPLSIYTPQR